MKTRWVLSLFLLSFSPIYSSNNNSDLHLGSSRFVFKSSADSFYLTDNFQNINIVLEKEFIIDPSEEEDEEASYISSFNFSDRVNSFEIGNGLIGIHISSFASMKEGSAQAAAGRDLFLIYNPANMKFAKNKLDFGITKQRQRYMGCLGAKTSHFIIADADKNGLVDIGRIKEELKCEDLSDSAGQMDGMSGLYYTQHSVEWYVYEDSSWVLNSINNALKDYVDLPLIEININPVDVFGYIKWRSYDPLKWNRRSEVFYYPKYRLRLIEKEKNQTD